MGELEKFTVPFRKPLSTGLPILILILALVAAGGYPAQAERAENIRLLELARFTGSGAEILAYDPATEKLVVTGGEGGELQILSLSNPGSPQLVQTLALFSTSVAVYNGLAAVASPRGENPGRVDFIDLNTYETVQTVTVGHLPDMVIFSPDGKRVLTANEGEPVGDFDPQGSVSVIDLSSGLASATVAEAGFSTFNGQRAALVQAGVRIFSSAGSVAQDLEPEFVAVSPDGEQAWVTLQENNALAVVDLELARVTGILPLGVKDWSESGLDPSGKDGPSGGPAINIHPSPVYGMYMPDSIVSFEAGGNTFLLTANEGEHRAEAVNASELQLDPGEFPQAPALQALGSLGMLNVSSQEGDLDGDGDFDRLFAYGGRSFSIWGADGTLIYDSGSEIEEITAGQTPSLFNSDFGVPARWDTRSRSKGPEPEAAAVGVVGGKVYGFIGLEQAGGGVLVYDISQPTSPQFVQYVRSDLDVATEGLVFIPAADSPSGAPLLLVSNEVSKTVTVYAIDGGAPSPSPTPSPTPPQPGVEEFRMFVPLMERGSESTTP
jgi:hypothetical protein